MNESYFQYYSKHPRILSPFDYRIRDRTEKFGSPGVRVTPVRLPMVTPLHLPEVNFCRFFKVSNDSVATQGLSQIFLEHYFCHGGFVFVYTDRYKSASSVGFRVFRNFSRADSLP